MNISKFFILADFWPRLRFSKVMEYAKCDKGNCVFEQGDDAYFFFMISKGEVSVIVDGEIKATLKRGQFFGDKALLYNAPRNATIRCEEDCRFWVLHQRHFQSSLRKIRLEQFKENKRFIEDVKFFGNFCGIPNFC